MHDIDKTRVQLVKEDLRATPVFKAMGAIESLVAEVERLEAELSAAQLAVEVTQPVVFYFEIDGGKTAGGIKMTTETQGGGYVSLIPTLIQVDRRWRLTLSVSESDIVPF